MKKIIAVTLIALAMSGCGRSDKWVAGITGSSEMCIDGVSYLQFTSGASVKYDKNTRQIATCNG